MARTVVVTGGTQGIGLAVARRFVADGDAVVITGRDGQRAEQVAAGIGATGLACEVTSPASVRELAEAVSGDVGVLVAMAGGNADLRPSAPPQGPGDLEATAEAWTANLDLNLLGTVLPITALEERMPAGSSIITVSSIGAEYAAASYGAAKAAVAAWTAGLSARLGPRGLTVNTIAPGYIEDTGFFQGRLTDERRDQLIAATHTGRAGTPDDVAGVARFLAGPDARHVTGQTIHVNGGAHTTR